MINDSNQFRLVQSGHGLSHLVMIYQNDPLALRPQQVIPADCADHPVLVIQDRITAVPAFQHCFLHVIQVIVEMKGFQFLPAGHASDGRCQIEPPGRAPCVERCGNDTGLRGGPPVFLRQVALAENHRPGLLFQRRIHHVRLAAAQDNAVRSDIPEIIAGAGQSDHHLAGERLEKIVLPVQDVPLQSGKHIQNRRVLHDRSQDCLHVCLRDRSAGHQAVERIVLIGDRQHVQIRILHHQVPGVAYRNSGSQFRRRVILHVAHLRPHRVDLHRRLKSETFQQEFRLIVQMPQPYRNIIVLAQHIAQRGIGDGCHNRIRVRIAVAADIGCHARISSSYASSPVRYPSGFMLCHRQESAHISSIPNFASQPSSAFALPGSQKHVAMSPARRGLMA